MGARLHFSMSGAGSPVLPPCTSIKRTRQNRTRPMRLVIALILVLLPTVAVAQPSQGVVTIPAVVGATRADRSGSAEVYGRSDQGYDVAAHRLRTLAPDRTADA